MGRGRDEHSLGQGQLCPAPGAFPKNPSQPLSPPSGAAAPSLPAQEHPPGWGHTGSVLINTRSRGRRGSWEITVMNHFKHCREEQEPPRHFSSPVVPTSSWCVYTQITIIKANQTEPWVLPPHRNHENKTLWKTITPFLCCSESHTSAGIE